MKRNPIRRHTLLAGAPLAVLLLAACDEQQVLYTVPAGEPIPAAPALPSMLDADGPALISGGPGSLGSAEELPPPTEAQFRPQDTAARPLDWSVLVGLRFPVPASYVGENPNSAMRVGQWRVPNAGGRPGELVAFHFGAGQGGDVEGNAGRWLSQFRSATPGTSPLRRYETATINGLRVSRITLEGTWTQTMMPGVATPPEPLENWALDAVIAEGGPEGTLFLRLTGPDSLVALEGAMMEHLAANIAIDGAPRSVGAPPPAIDTLTAAAVADAAAASGAPAPAAESSAEGVVVHGIAIPMGADWQRQQPASSMRALQASLPAADGNADQAAELVGFYFGPAGGGSVEDNLRRWAGQVKGAEPTRESITRGALTLHVLRAAGTYTPSPMGMSAAPSAPREDQALVGVVIEGGPEGAVYLRITGPAATIATHEKAISDLIAGIQSATE